MYKWEVLKSQSRVWVFWGKHFVKAWFPWSNFLEQVLLFDFMKVYFFSAGIQREITSSQLIFTVFEDHDQLKIHEVCLEKI